MNDIAFAIVKKARMETEKEVVSENMMGVDFTRLLCECKPIIRIVHLNDNYGASEMEFKKGEW